MRMQVGHAVWFGAVGSLMLGLTAGCGDSPSEPGHGMVDSGSWYRTGYRWPHDGNPYESTNVIVFSDAASLESRLKIAEIVEDLMTTLIDDFQIDPATMFKWPPGQTKLHIYTYRDHFEEQWGGKGYYGGFMMYSLDHPIRNTEIGNYTRVVTHELMHAYEGLMKGTENPRIVDVWLSEGIAEYVSGGTSRSGNITSLAMLDSLSAVWEHVNPITMHYYEDFPNQVDAGYLYLYALFELSMRYLLDADGLGHPKSLVRDVMIDAGNGAVFATSFEEKFGIGLQQFEDEYWDRVRDLLE
jgi:hypothetical protein